MIIFLVVLHAKFLNKYTNKNIKGKLTMDNLEMIFEMQRSLAEIIKSPRYPRQKEERISALSTAIIHEAIELQRLTNWKWWKKPVSFDEEMAKEEIIDIWHFVIQASLELGMTPSDILKEYSKKNQINRNRQEYNY
jgi:dimeric dUTPase (all-alpha-NTP-PPase superfamily)